MFRRNNHLGGLSFDFDPFTMYCVDSSSAHSSDDSDSSTHYTHGGGGHHLVPPSTSYPAAAQYYHTIDHSGSTLHQYPGANTLNFPNDLTLDPSQSSSHDLSPDASHPLHFDLDMQMHGGPLPRAQNFSGATAVAPYQLEGNLASSSTPYLPTDSLMRRIEGMLRADAHISPNLPVALASLNHPVEAAKPTFHLQTLTAIAIYESPSHRRTLQEIYAALEHRFAFYRHETMRCQPKPPSWKQSIRHLLSLKKAFRNVNRDITESGKGAYWELTGETGDKRARVRKGRRHGTPDDDEGDGLYVPTSSSAPGTSRYGRNIRVPYAPGPQNRAIRSNLSVNTDPSVDSGSPGPYSSPSPSAGFIVESPQASSPTLMLPGHSVNFTTQFSTDGSQHGHLHGHASGHSGYGS